MMATSTGPAVPLAVPVAKLKVPPRPTIKTTYLVKGLHRSRPFQS